MNGTVRVIKLPYLSIIWDEMYASVAESMNDDDDNDDIPCFFIHKEMQILEALQMTSMLFLGLWNVCSLNTCSITCVFSMCMCMCVCKVGGYTVCM